MKVYKRMLGPEGITIQNTTVTKDEKDLPCKEMNKLPHEGTGSFELNSFRNPKNWKKSITSFFRNQLRSTKSNEGDSPSGSKSDNEEKEINREQKWQSLGKVFRRQSFVDRTQKSSTQRDETSPQNKRLALRKVLSSYFGKVKTPNQMQSDENENST